MMASAAVIGLSAGKRLLSSSYYSDITEKLSCGYDYGSTYHQAASTKNVITANKSSNNSTSFLSNQHTRSLKAQKEHVNTAAEPSIAEVWLQRLNHLEEDRSHSEFSVEALLLLQKSMLEKQWNLSTETVITDGKRENTHKKMQVTGSGTSARRRRIDTRRKVLRRNSSMIQLGTSKQLKCIIRPELLQNRLKGYVKGVTSEELLTHSEVVQLSKIIKTGLYSEEQKSRECLKVIPHEKFSFAKIWLLAAQFEIRQLNLKGARLILGNAIGKAPKDKIFKKYIEIELQLGNIDRCRKLYKKYLECAPENCYAWSKYAELERSLSETERARSILELAIAQPALDMPELWN